MNPPPKIVNCGTNPPEKRCWTIKEYALRNRVDEKTVQRWIARGIINFRRFGRTIRIYERDPLAPDKKIDPAYQ